jgi:hypothetical protein
MPSGIAVASSGEMPERPSSSRSTFSDGMPTAIDFAASPTAAGSM